MYFISKILFTQYVSILSIYIFLPYIMVSIQRHYTSLVRSDFPALLNLILVYNRVTGSINGYRTTRCGTTTTSTRNYTSRISVIITTKYNIRSSNSAVARVRSNPN